MELSLRQGGPVLSYVIHHGLLRWLCSPAGTCVKVILRSSESIIGASLLLGSAHIFAEELPVLTDVVEQGEATSVLPPIPSGLEQDRRLSALPGLEVREFRFEGNTIFSDSQLREQVAEWEGGWVTPNGLRDVQARLTRFYVESGYVISGALLPDQEVLRPSGFLLKLDLDEISLLI